MDEALERRIAAELDRNGDLAPPWARHPEIPAGSIGWRMGGGEDWMVLWQTWVMRLPRSRAERVAYLRRHPPAPRTWQDLAMRVVHPMLTEDDELERHDAMLRELEELGIVADDAAYGAWLARHDPPPAPWAWGRTFSAMAEVGTRALGFAARWAIPRRGPALFPGPVPTDWEPFAGALRRGALPARLPDDPHEALALLLAAHGEPPPPWARGGDPAALERRDPKPPSYEGAWARWAATSFDDGASWRSYLARHPSPPPAWDAAVRRRLSFLAGR